MQGSTAHQTSIRTFVCCCSQVGPPSQESSELQVKLLSALLPKLWLKLGLAAIQHGVALARLQQRLLAHIELTEVGKLCIAAARRWKAAAVPSPQEVAAAESHWRSLQQRQKRRLVRAWQTFAQHRRWGPPTRLAAALTLSECLFSLAWL